MFTYYAPLPTPIINQLLQMKTTLTITIIFVSMLTTLKAQQPTNAASLNAGVQQTLANANGKFAVAFKDLQTGQSLLINEQFIFHAASTMKTPVLVELYKQAASGKFSLKDSIVIKNNFSSIADGSPYMLNPSDDSEAALYRAVGQKTSLDALAYQMIIASSNLATNMMIELVTAASVMHTLQELGITGLQVLRGVEDNKAYEKGLNNTTTAYAQLQLFELMALQKLVSKNASQCMIDILLDQQFNEIIPAHLPPAVKVAHKTGSITGIQHDCGIVYLPDGRKYVLVLLSKFEGDEKAAIETMANISKQVYDFMMQH
jgi:beta-lactamase class A